MGGHWQAACRGYIPKDSAAAGALVVVQGGVAEKKPAHAMSGVVYSPDQAWAGYNRIKEQERADEVAGAPSEVYQRWWTWGKGSRNGKRVKIGPYPEHATHFRDSSMPEDSQRRLNTELLDVPHGEDKTVFEKLQQAQEDRVELSPAILNTALSKVSKEGSGNPHMGYRFLITVAVNSVLKGTSQFHDAELAGVVYSLTRLGAVTDSILEIFLVEIRSRGVAGLTTDEIARVLWVLAVKKMYSEVVFAKAGEELLPRIKPEPATEDNFATVVSLYWSFTKSAVLPAEHMLLTYLRTTATILLTKTAPKARDCVTFLWSLATNSPAGQQLPYEIVKTCCDRMIEDGVEGLAVSDICCFLWAVSRAKGMEEVDVIVKEVAARLAVGGVKSLVKEAGAGEVVKAVVCLVTSGKADEAKMMVQKLVESLDEPGRNPLFAELAPDDLCNLAWVLRGFTSSTPNIDKMYHALSAECINRDLLPRFSMTQILSLLSSFASSSVPSPKLFTTAKDDLLTRHNFPSSLTPTELSQLVHAYHSTRLYPPDLFMPIQAFVTTNIAAYQDLPCYGVIYQAIWGFTASQHQQ
eukprot:TRINITY_DN46738_c0_g1_i1.p1 TRINITY_DN46738_c0_g1~~TRINITY_DN46738_c0_g1_i1.p1  ORF type:complete len:645 (+),score=187.58 TRINITY_DN46738_c0_g1_i1:201-1937(+)